MENGNVSDVEFRTRVGPLILAWLQTREFMGWLDKDGDGKVTEKEFDRLATLVHETSRVLRYGVYRESHSTDKSRRSTQYRDFTTMGIPARSHTTRSDLFRA